MLKVPTTLVVKKSLKNDNVHRWTRHETIPVEKMVRGENAWISKVSTDENEKILKEVISILNKLSKDNFEPLSEKLFIMDNNNKSLVQNVIKVIFQKAINEPHFGEVYPSLCKKLSDKNYCIAKDCEAIDSINFKREILTECQKEFEKEKTNIDDKAEKRKSLGNIKFIGELFIKGVISYSIVFKCIDILVVNIQGIDCVVIKNENIECICKLIKTTGKFLDTEDYKTRLEHYIDILDDISKDTSNDFRSRFMIKDVLDLKNNKWVERRLQETVKTKKEIRADHENKNVPKERERYRFSRK